MSGAAPAPPVAPRGWARAAGLLVVFSGVAAANYGVHTWKTASESGASVVLPVAVLVGALLSIALGIGVSCGSRAAMTGALVVTVLGAVPPAIDGLWPAVAIRAVVVIVLLRAIRVARGGTAP